MGVDYTARLDYGYLQPIEGEYGPSIDADGPSVALQEYADDDEWEGDGGDNWTRAYNEEYDTDKYALGCEVAKSGTDMDVSDYNRYILCIEKVGASVGFGEIETITPTDLEVRPEWNAMLLHAAEELGLPIEGEPGWHLSIKQW